MSPFPSEHPDFMELSMHSGRDHAVALLAGASEDVASGSSARLLITGSTQPRVETLARRIHGGGPRAQFPFVQIEACELPVDREALRQYCGRFLDAAAGGSVLLNAVEEMPAAVQAALIDLLDRLQGARRPSTTVRLISGTTVSLLDRATAGTFSDRLFYRLNVIHLMEGVRLPASPTPIPLL